MLRICTIGCGTLATSAHGPSYARYAATHPDAGLAACCDLDEAKAVAFRHRFGFARAATDLEAMLDRERPNAVCLVVPVPATAELACRVLRLGYPLLTEKPPGRTTDELETMIAAAETTGAPNQVAFNRRHLPLLCELKRRLTTGFAPSDLRHLRYEFTRVRRYDADFSTTAIHGIDAVRFLAGSDYAEVRLHYQPLPHFGPAVANIYLDCTFRSGATAHLSFCPATGAVVERATAYLDGHTFLAHLPIWGGVDPPGRLLHYVDNQLTEEVAGDQFCPHPQPFMTNGFYAENAAFFDALRAGRRPVDDLTDARQSVAIAQCLRERRTEFHA